MVQAANLDHLLLAKEIEDFFLQLNIAAPEPLSCKGQSFGSLKKH